MATAGYTWSKLSGTMCTIAFSCVLLKKNCHCVNSKISNFPVDTWLNKLYGQPGLVNLPCELIIMTCDKSFKK